MCVDRATRQRDTLDPDTGRHTTPTQTHDTKRHITHQSYIQKPTQEIHVNCNTGTRVT